MVTSDFRPEMEIRPFRTCAMYPAIIIGTVRSLWTWLLGRYHVPQNTFLVGNIFRIAGDFPTSTPLAGGAEFGRNGPNCCVCVGDTEVCTLLSARSN